MNGPCCSDTVDTSLHLPCNGGAGNVNINLSNEASKATSDALTLRSVASTFPFVEPGPGGALDRGQHPGHVSRAQVGRHRVRRDGREPLRARQRGIQGCNNI